MIASLFPMEGALEIHLLFTRMKPTSPNHGDKFSEPSRYSMDDEDGRGQSLERFQESGQRAEPPGAPRGMSTSSLSRAQRNSQNEAREITDTTLATNISADSVNCCADYLDTFIHPPACVKNCSNSSYIYYSPFSSSNLHMLAETKPSKTQLVRNEFPGQKGERP